MKKYTINIQFIFLIFFSISLKAQNSYFTLGSSENTVIRVQGQPNSITRVGNFSSFIYGNSSVTFANKLVEGYVNKGNLKIIVGMDEINNISAPKKTINNSKKNVKKVNKEIKWIYFTLLSSSIHLDLSDISGKLNIKENEYSKLYSIQGYTNERQKNLEFCLIKNYKEFYGDNIKLIPHIYDDRDLALQMWNNERGDITRVSSCFYLNQYGVTEH